LASSWFLFFSYRYVNHISGSIKKTENILTLRDCCRSKRFLWLTLLLSEWAFCLLVMRK